MRNALILLSPLQPSLLDAASGVMAARMLKQLGTQRANLTTFPQFSYIGPAQIHKAYAVPDFVSAARLLTEVIFRPMLGQSDICDISHVQKSQISPQFETLKTVGGLFANKAMPANRHMDAHDGGDLGLIFYLALHARPHGAGHYDLLICPHISERARQGLSLFGDMAGPDLGIYGTTINQKCADAWAHLSVQNHKFLISAYSIV